MYNEQALQYIIDNFYDLAQQIIETFYLKPFQSCDSKANLKDGAIERLIHGGMHVGRAQFYPIIIHQLIKEKFPQLIEDNLNILKKILGLNEQQILFLIRYAILFHDSARKDDFQDRWDKGSAKNCYDFFIAQGISELIAKIFSEAITYKDDSAGYSQQLIAQFNKSSAISVEQYNQLNSALIIALQYVRNLIYLADCLDIMRCVGSFQLSKVYKAFENFPEEQRQDFYDNVLLSLVENIHKLIIEQKDMLYDCQVQDDNGLILQKIAFAGIFDSKEKVKYEHANNVCSVIGASMEKIEYFAKYLLDEKQRFKDTTEAVVNFKSKFNPFIHGTNSLALAILEKTNLELMSPIDMLERFGLAPMGGEISGGGLDKITARCNPCFGRLKSISLEEGGEYTLNKIISNYSNMKTETNRDNILDLIKSTIDAGFKISFNNINILLIYIARARQFGLQPMTSIDAGKLKQNLQATIQYFYLILLLGKYIHPDVVYLKGLEKRQREHFISAVEFHLTYETLITKIIENNIDVENIYNNPNEDNLKRALEIFELPLQIPNLEWGSFLSKREDVVLPCQQIFTLENVIDYRKTTYDFYDVDYLFGALLKNQQGYTIANLLKELIAGRQSKKSLCTLTAMLQNYPNDLKKKLQILNTLQNQDTTALLGPQYTTRMQFFTSKLVPIIFVYENEEKMRLIDLRTLEYRSNEVLKIGSDIKMIATDNHENRLLLMKFLEENGISNVSVVLFDQLFNSMTTDKAPETQYIRGGGPTLAWLAAKKISEQPEMTKQFKLTMSTVIMKEGKLDKTKVASLVADACQLNTIRFH